MPLRYIFISGGVFSGLGKGIVTSSVGQALQVRGYKINVLKIDPYLNIDAGTMNPFEHGETYVASDGTELDVDFGHYERMLNLEITGEQNITTGQVYLEVINKERNGEYLGQTVQIVPHVTNEIKRRITEFGEKQDIDFLLIEIGGTVGDIESLPFFEAIRQLRLEIGYNNTFLIHTTYVPKPPNINEFKTKPTQHSIMELRRIGLIPSAVVCRSHEPLTKKEIRKISIFSDVKENAVFSLPNLPLVLEAPLVLDKQGLGDLIIQHFGVERREPDWSKIVQTLQYYRTRSKVLRIGITGKYTRGSDSYISVKEALIHAGAHEGYYVDLEWISAETLETDEDHTEYLKKFDGILVPGGFGSRGVEGKIKAIRIAREQKLPFLGICLGFQLATIEFARNVLGLSGATSEEFDRNAEHKIICYLPDQANIEKMGGTMRRGSHEVELIPGTLIYEMYNQQKKIKERHRHRYEVNPEYAKKLEEKGLVFSAYSDNGLRREALELPSHPFFFGTQFHPEFTSRPWAPSPPYHYFVKACIKRAEERGETRPTPQELERIKHEYAE